MTGPTSNTHSRNVIRAEPGRPPTSSLDHRGNTTRRGDNDKEAADTPLRNDIETTTPCPICGRGFTPIRRQQYCTPACRQRAWRARHHDPSPPPVAVAPPPTPRRDITVYQCPVCDVRRLGQQWCHDCNRPTARVDLGGLCPACDEPVAISDLTDQHPRPQITPMTTLNRRGPR